MQLPDSNQPKLIAFYLPQFHPIPENDAWWGTGFTEWRNVARAKPLYRGHYQPHLPADLGFYDLRVPEVRRQQAALASEYGIYAFCYYYYWFNGRKLLERPLQEVITLGEPDFPFCICWANENWSRRWDGSEQEILLAQEYSPRSDEQFILDILPVLKDPRYVRVSNRPLLLVYRVDQLPHPRETADTWRAVAAANGIAELQLCAVQSFGIQDPRAYGFDAAVEFPPHGLTRENVEHHFRGLSLRFTGRIEDYRRAASLALSEPTAEYTRYRSVMVGWDNTPRRAHGGYVFEHATPENYFAWLSALVQQSRTSPGGGELIFINAWNEWAEGAHLEPDLRHGRAFLEATRRALVAVPDPVPEPHASPPLVSVVVPMHDDASRVAEALESVEGQTYDNIELVIVDDGSSDDQARVLEKVLCNSRFKRVIFRRQPRLGLAVAIERGIALSTGSYVNILTGDDLFAGERFATLVRRARPDRDVFLFSGVSLYCSRTLATIDCEGPDPRAKGYRDALRLAAATPTAGFALLGSGLPISISNFFFSRSLFDALGGFSSELPRAFDWEVALRATCFVEPQFVADDLLTHRYFQRQSPQRLPDMAEARTALGRFVEVTKDGTQNQLAPTRSNWPTFFDVFTASISPWFGSEPLAQYMPARNGFEQADPNVPRGRDQAALRRFEEAQHNHRLADASVAALCAEMTQGWARFLHS